MTKRLDDKDFLDGKYRRKDPWGYQSNDCDIHRKERILYFANKYGPYKQALDIGAGEGWITEDLPAEYVWGHELSDVAADRFPGNVDRYIEGDEIPKCDLVLLSGVLYVHYDYNHLLDILEQSATDTVITCHITEAEIPIPWLAECMVDWEIFEYRGKTETLRVYRL